MTRLDMIRNAAEKRRQRDRDRELDNDFIRYKVTGAKMTAGVFMRRNAEIDYVLLRKIGLSQRGNFMFRGVAVLND